MTDVYTEAAAVVETRLVHDVHRRATELLVRSAGRRSASSADVRALRDFVVATLRHHHQREDEELWPIVVELAPDLGEVYAELTRDHTQLDTVLAPLSDAGAAAADRRGLLDAAGALRDLLHRHLELEEPALFPVLRTQLPPEEWEAFSRHAVETSPPETAPLMIAFLDRVGTPPAVDLVLTHLPQPARAALPLLRLQGTAILDPLEEASA